MPRKKVNLPDGMLDAIGKEPENLSDFVRTAVGNELQKRHPKKRFEFEEIRPGRPKKEGSLDEV